MIAKYVYRGDVIDYTPEVDVAAGSVVVIGSIIGITKLDIKSGQLGALALVGVFDIVKATGEGTAIAFIGKISIELFLRFNALVVLVVHRQSQSRINKTAAAGIHEILRYSTAHHAILYVILLVSALVALPGLPSSRAWPWPACGLRARTGMPVPWASHGMNTCARVK